MKIFTGDYSKIRNDIELLLESIYHSANKLERMSQMSLLYLLINDYGMYDYNAALNYARLLSKNRTFVAESTNVAKQLSNKILDDFFKNKKMHVRMCGQILKRNEEVLYEDISYDLPNGILYDEELKYEILLDFFRQKHPEIIPYFDKLISDRRIIQLEEIESSTKNCHCGGNTLFNVFTKNFHMFIAEDDSDILQLSAIAHEFGHVADYLELINRVSPKEYGYYPFKSILIETISSLVEKEFLEFAIENNLDPRYAECELQNYYLNIFKHFNELSLLCTLSEKIIKTGKYVSLPKEKLYSVIAKNQEDLIDYEMFPDPEQLNIYSDLEYGYGKLLATYFSYLQKHNQDKYNESMSEFLKLRTGYFPTDLYVSLKTTPQDIVTIVKEEINSSPAKINIKKIV